MRRLLLWLTLVVALAGCGKSEDQARVELAQRNIVYSEPSFIDNARMGNGDVVGLFLDSGWTPI